MSVNPEKFWDRIAFKYSQHAIADMESYSRKLKATQARMSAHMNVLEFGCGTGSTALEHAPHVGHILATDISKEMIKIGNEKVQKAGISNITFKQSGIVELDEPENSFDMVLALNLLHLLPNRAAALKSIHRLLKPGGVFISSTVCLSDRMWFLRPVIPLMQWLGKAPYVEFLGADNVRHEIAALGFDELEYFTHGRSNSLFLISKKT